MGSLTFIISTTKPPDKVYTFTTKISRIGSLIFGKETLTFQGSCKPKYSRGDHFLCLLAQEHHSNPLIDGEEDDPEDYVQALRVPDDWLNPSKAMEVDVTVTYPEHTIQAVSKLNGSFHLSSHGEAAWLKATLHKWLDDEYCPEATNAEISKVAAHSYYESLMEKETDLGEILLKMAMSLGYVSFQESFHGAFSSANAAVNLIIQRIEQ